MAFHHNLIENWKCAPAVQTIRAENCLFYAPSVGMGWDPLDRGELPFAYGPEIRVLPTMAAAVCMPGFWVEGRRMGLNYDSFDVINPRIIHCAISRYGQDGTKSKKPADAPMVYAPAVMT